MSNERITNNEDRRGHFVLRTRHSLLAIAALLASSAMVAGCMVNDASPSAEATVQSHFFPLDNGLIYAYRRFNNNRYDTLQLRIKIGQPPSTTNELDNIATGLPYYYIGFTHDADNNLAAMLSTDTSKLMALDGSLQDSATWVADEVSGIHATVVAQYDDYYLPGDPLRKTDYISVLVVEYHQNGQPASNYILRYFARDHGLILEQQLVGPGTEITSLQLISIHSD
ncbi:MAG TPA: hypothetical protein VFD13_00390 [Candidatus Kapabacteria bacterium]|nr:hypothetical protein [Candidatus Kapabacteria bacterium]